MVRPLSLIIIVLVALGIAAGLVLNVRLSQECKAQGGVYIPREAVCIPASAFR